MDIAVVLNARAGNGSSVTGDELAERIRKATGREVAIYEITDSRDPCACTRAAIADGARLVIAAGGDGTVSACATELVDYARRIGDTARIELGVLPLGTSNSFAAALEIPADLDGAIANLARPDRRKLDAALVKSTAGERLMILHCMIGLHAEAIASTTTAAKQRWGVLAYAAAALRTFASFDPFGVEISTGTHHVRCRAVAVAAANVAPPKTVLAHGPSHLLADDGQIDITIVALESLAEAIATGVHLYRSALDHEPATRDNVGSFSAASISLVAEPAQQVLLDGEPFGETPIRIDTLHGALVVVAPAAAIAEGPPVEASLIGLPDLAIDGVPID